MWPGNMKLKAKQINRINLRYVSSKPQRRFFGSRRRAGAALVEFAIVAPLMILFTMGLIDIGRMTMVKQLLVTASREGARQASLPAATSDSVQADVLQMLSNSGVTGVVTISPSSVSSTAPGSTITVTIAADANSVSWMGSSMFMSGKNLTASTSMRREAF